MVELKIVTTQVVKKQNNIVIQITVSNNIRNRYFILFTSVLYYKTEVFGHTHISISIEYPNNCN